MNFKVEANFKHKGLPCLILGMGSGYRCGYVGVPKGHPYYNVNYHTIPVEVHGGLTYGRVDDIYPIPNNSKYYFLGFDCAHWDDALDLELVKELSSKNKLEDKLCCLEHFISGHKWTTEEVMAEVISLADQVYEGGNHEPQNNDSKIL